jgi:hypothetical protein
MGLISQFNQLCITHTMASEFYDKIAQLEAENAIETDRHLSRNRKQLIRYYQKKLENLPKFHLILKRKVVFPESKKPDNPYQWCYVPVTCGFMSNLPKLVPISPSPRYPPIHPYIDLLL